MHNEKTADDGHSYHLDRVQSFFSSRSSDYNSDSSRFPWSWLRGREGEAVKKAIGSLSTITVLDMGAGAGHYSRLALELGAAHVVALDLSGDMLSKLSNPGITTVVGDAASCDLHQKFERIICAGMLEFVPDPGAVLANARRHATGQARLVVLAPAASFGGFLYRRYHRRNGLNIWNFSKEQLLAVAESSGWTLESYQFVWPFTHVARLRVSG